MNLAMALLWAAAAYHISGRNPFLSSLIVLAVVDPIALQEEGTADLSKLCSLQ